VIRKIFAAAAALTVFAATAFAAGKGKNAPAPVPAVELQAEKLFTARDWKGMEALLNSGEKLTPRALSLAANALWYQKQYARSLELMERVGTRYPRSVAPYARLLMALAQERTEKPQEAYGTAIALWRDKSAPSLAKFYAMYALVRLTENKDEKEKWLRRMLDLTSDKARRGTVCRELLSIGRLSPTDALALLRLEPQNAAALKLAAKAPDSPQKFYRLGYAAHLRGDHKTAVANLSRLKLNAPYGESGTYYLCVSLQRMDRSLEAEPLLEKLVLKKDSEYMARGMGRLRLMIGGKAHAKALAALQEMSQNKNTEIAKQALYTLAVSRWEKADEARDEYLERFPTGRRANRLRWDRGWARYRAGDPEGALKNWRGADATSPQILYWRAKAHDDLHQPEQAKELREQLLKKHALTVYAFLTEPEGSLKITDTPLPAALQPGRPTELERWGFVSHAHMLLQNAESVRERAHRARMAQWLGLDWQVYRDLHGVAEEFMAGPSVSRKLLEYIYPRPFRSTVEAAAKKYHVDPLYIWSIMKQESGFNPTVSSWVGAAGLMQLMPSTAAGEARRMKLKKYSLYGVHDNINMGAHHIAGLIAAWKHLEWVAAAYNAGGGNVKKWNAERADWDMDAWMEAVPFRETNGYVKNVMRNYYVYQKIYGKTDMSKFSPEPPASDDAQPDPALDASEAPVNEAAS